MTDDRALILLVDDDPSLRALLSATLSSSSFEVVEAQGGTEAVALAARRRPDAVVLDWHMPDGSGADALRKIKEHHRDLPVIVLTAEQRSDQREVAEGLGATAYLTKPFSPLAFLRTLEEIAAERTTTRPS
jgi:CheY-like chemotaxis protein